MWGYPENTVFMIADINDLEQEWETKISDYEFVGELALTRAEYEHYSLIFNSYYKKNCFLHKTKVILVVLAVNCAYFEYDDEGFWKHFLSRIGLENENYNQRDIGSTIESYLCTNNFLDTKREGPFRYVGAILDQCGVTRRYLPCFAEFLKAGVERYSWAGLITISKASYDDLLPETGMPGYLYQFLNDPAGWRFTKDVARSIVQAKQQPSPFEYLKSLIGFRPSFWQELWEYLEADIRKNEAVHRINIPLPKFVYQPQLNQLAVLFDESNVRAGNYRLDGRGIDHFTFELKCENDFREIYTVEVRQKDFTKRIVELKGWVPNEKQPYAFFEAENGEFIHSPTHLSGDSYYLIISTTYFDKLPAQLREQLEGEDCIADYGWLNLPSGIFYGRLITAEAAINLLDCSGVAVDKDEQIRLSWDNNAKRLNGAADLFDVFVEDPPNLIVTKPVLFDEGRLILMGDFGDGSESIKIPEGSSKVKLKCSVPTKGEVWVESRGRYREGLEESLNQRLSFCCVPDCEIIWPNKLHSLSDEPEIEIRGDESISVSFEDGCIATDSDRRCWKILPGKFFVDGVLKVKNRISVRLSKMIHRASLQDEQGHPLDTLTLKEFSSNEILILTGYPRGPAKLFIQECGTYRALADFGKFDEAGRLKFNIASLEDTLCRSQLIAGRLGIEYYGKKVFTETRILNTEKIVDRLMAEDDDLNWAETLSLGHKKIFKDLQKGIAQKLDRSCLADCNCLPDQLSDWGKEILYCAWFFDGVNLEDYLQPPLFPKNDERRQAFEWLRKARAVSNADKENSGDSAETLLAKLKSITWRPATKRWCDAFNEILARLNADTQLTELLHEWKKDVIGNNYFIKYKSRIGQMAAGQEVTNAWRYYCNNDYKSAYNRAKYVLERSSSPVADLALILINMLLLKNNTPEQVENIEGGHHKKLLPYIEKSIWLCKKASGENFELTTEMSDGVDIEVLPLKDKDLELF